MITTRATTTLGKPLLLGSSLSLPLGQETLLLLNEAQIIILRFLFVISVLEKHHPTGSKICCCIPRFRTPVCVLSVLVKSAAELQQKSALLGKYSILGRGSFPRTQTLLLGSSRVPSQRRGIKERVTREANRLRRGVTHSTEKGV